jgi:hypothetical protein
MPSNLNLEVILSLVDKLTGPMKQASGSLNALGKEAKETGAQLGRPTWTEHERQLGRISDATNLWSTGLGGVASAAGDVEELLGRPTWDEHGRSIIKATGKVREHAEAVGSVASAAGAISGAPIKEQAEESAKATGKMREHEQAIAGASSAWEQLGQMAVVAIGAMTGVSLIKGMIEAGSDAVHQQVDMQTAGISLQDQTNIHGAAANLTRQFPTQPQTEIEGMITRARAIVTGGTEEAIAAMPDLLKLKTIRRLNWRRAGRRSRGAAGRISPARQSARASPRRARRLATQRPGSARRCS